MTRILTALAFLLLVAGPLAAQSVTPREGWRVIETDFSYSDLLERLRAAVKAEEMDLVTEAGPTEAARARGEKIPGNRVLGVFRSDFAVRALRASVPAMIEAPIRFYVTEEPDGSATLSWKTPNYVFAPYLEEGGKALAQVAAELNAIFEVIAARATAE